MDDFPSNSHKARDADRVGRTPKEEPKKKIEKVVTGSVKRRKKPLGRRFAEHFFGGRAKGTATDVMLDVLIPAAKDMVVDAVIQGAERAVFGEARSAMRRGGRPGLGSHYTNYTSRYSTPPAASRTHPVGRREEPRALPSRRSRAMHNFEECIVDTRGEAMEVLDRMVGLIEQFEFATVSDLYGFLDINADFTDEKWGWMDLHDADIRRVPDGYLLVLPRPEPID